MKDKNLMTEIDTYCDGEGRTVRHSSCLSNLRLSTVVRVLDVDYSDNSMSVSVDCEALDCLGLVFKVIIFFTCESATKRSIILKDMRIGAAFMVEGAYAIFFKDKTVSMHNPSYRQVGKDMFEDIRRMYNLSDDADCKPAHSCTHFGNTIYS